MLGEVTAEENGYEGYCEKHQSGLALRVKQDCVLASFFREMAKPTLFDHSSQEFDHHLTKTLSHIKTYKRNCEQHKYAELE